MKKNPPTQEYCRLLSLELVFLGHALPTCTEEELKPFLDGNYKNIPIVRHSLVTTSIKVLTCIIT